MASSLLSELSILKLSEVHGKPDNKNMAYGTAGFRGKAILMDHVFFRMGLLAVLRSKLKKMVVGIMITASHNPVDDNGVKLIDPYGEMLEESWEKFATDIVNTTNDNLIAEISRIVKNNSIDLSQTANVFIARDTRPSSLSLCQAASDGITALSGNCRNFGLLTTPQLHYIVAEYNMGNLSVDEEFYYKHFSDAYKALVDEKSEISTLTVDCANGVGAPKLLKLHEYFGGNVIDLVIHNDGQSSSGVLNEKCGADYVKMQQRAPKSINLEPYRKYASFDGDADRIVYYTLDSDCNFVLLDGDKIATLIASYIKQLIDKANLEVRLGIVQTAYANGSSTKYLKDDLKVEVACARTGIKHLHHKAKDFDIGVYFEANGHGTVLVKEECHKLIKEAALNNESAKTLQTFLAVINETVGDAISDMLAVEAILLAKNWSVREWSQMYTDLPNRQLKVKVQDRSAIQTTDSERKTTKPQGLQNAIDVIVASYPSARSFVRPSGTEDVVRVYAESDTQENADSLARKVSILVYDLAGGVGEKPNE